MIERKPLQSTMIVSAGFDAEAGVLEIEFRGREIYEYRGGVSEFLYRRLLAAPSAGKFFHDEIEGKFPCIHASSPRWRPEEPPEEPEESPTTSQPKKPTSA